MPIDTSPSTVATSALQAIPFGTLIGAPLDAAIEAQARAAKTTTDFITAVGFDADGKAKQVIFDYNREGKIVTLVVPLLTIIPIPYIQVDRIDINFKANISASASSVLETTESTTAGGEVSAGWGRFGARANFKANYSSKKDSTSTQDSRYSVEYTMDITVAASQSSMPTGLATVLNILQGSIAGSERGGQIVVTPESQTMSEPKQELAYTFNVKDENGVNLAGRNVSLKIETEAKVTFSVAAGTAAPTDKNWTGTTDSDGNVTFTVSASATPALTSPATAVVTGTANTGGAKDKTVTAALTLLPSAFTTTKTELHPGRAVMESPALHAGQAALQTLAVLDAEGNALSRRTLSSAERDAETVLDIAYGAVEGAGDGTSSRE